MSSHDPISTDAEVASPAFIDKDNVEGDYSASSIRAAMINRPRQELYDYWSDITNLPTFMENVKAVDVLESGRSTQADVRVAGVSVGKVVAKVLQREPRVQARRELRRFKQLMEAGEVSTSKAPDAAPRASRHF